MSAFADALSATSSGLKAQSLRLRTLAENIANVDTPGYRRKSVPFEAKDAAQSDLTLVSPGKVTLDQSERAQIYDPAHPLADATGHYQGSNVDLLIEVADAREAQRSYEANLRMFEQTRQMSASLLDLLRR
ncbi:flagellar basal body rod protein FlgC [Alloyangia pacifica]|uniref:flagellar basal body rod protein FlgC n=1 Tax=Alloyangia pacifica TaxID=311180 RepID=UPI001CD440B0|nr:flagellar basal body rod protein FlgC [Alloyangia pacifica]MCA0995421.1 flagellar basal body rod protein FlgC [Alloyangia pacifica]